ncbi:MAG: endonuclease/exonuclease/phosphatase family protein [Actinomycetota bacterium]
MVRAHGFRGGMRWVTIVVTVIAALAYVSPARGDQPAPSASEAAGPATPVRLRVMTFNIEYGGTVVDLAKILAAVRRSGADVVAFNEVYGKAARLGRLTGYDHVSRRLDIVSRYPLVDPPGSGGRYVFVELAPGQVVAITNVHLASSDYGPRRLLDGWGRRKVLRTERRVRLPEIRPFLRSMTPLVSDGIPAIVVGDMNAPSHEDYTAATVGLRPQVRFPVRWPVSLLMARRGFVDSFRAAHPDPVADEGLTWPAGRPRSDDSWNPRRDAPQDRIDQIWSAGSVTVADSELVGERDGPGVGISLHPWGSDHRAVVSTLDVTPGVPPVMVAPDPLLTEVGATLTVTYHAPGGAGERLRIVPSGGDPVADVIDSQGTPPGAATDGSVLFPTDTLAPGAYDVVLIDGVDAELARGPFWVRDVDAPPVLDTSRWRFAAGEAIEASWTFGRANRFDWIGLYDRDADPTVASYHAYEYSGADVEGSVTFRGRRGAGPLPPGRYTAYYLLTDVYRDVASVDFVVTD